MDKEQKLYKVTLRGMTYSSTGVVYGESYVVATDSNDAYEKVRDWLNDNDIGFKHERELCKVELLAGTNRYTDTKTLLYL